MLHFVLVRLMQGLVSIFLVRQGSMVAIDRPPSAGRAPMVAVRFGPQSEWRRVWRRLKRNRPALGGLAIVGAIALLAVFPQAVAPYSPFTINSALRGNAP